MRLSTIQSTRAAEWNSRLGVAHAVERLVQSGRLSAPAATAWLADLAERDARGRFFATGMLFMVAGTKPRHLLGVQP